MEKLRKILPVIFCILFTGCNVPDASKSKLVTGVRIETEQRSLCRNYTDPQKMETVLSYLRALDQRKVAQTDPERFSGVSYHIELYYSDGSNRHIFQHANRFLSEDFRPWQELNPEYAAFLEPLLHNMPSD